MSESRAARLVISGYVQGVFYRQSSLQEAERLGVTGWVRNLENGCVEMLIEGEASAVQAMIDWAHEGPPMARVTGVNVEELPPTGHTAAFGLPGKNGKGPLTGPCGAEEGT